MSMAVGNNESETDPPTAVAAVSAAPKAPTGSSRRSPRSPKTARENLRSPVKSPKSSARLAVAETAPSSAADDAFFNDKFLEEAEFAMLIFAAIIYAFFICLYNFCFKIYMIIQKLIQFVQMCREHPVIFRQTCRIIYNGYGEWWTVCGVIRFMFEAPPPNVYVEQSLSDAPTEGGWDFSWMSMRSSSNTSSAETASTDKNDFVMKSRQYSLLPLTEDSSAAFSAPRYDLEFVGTVADAVKPWRPPPRSSRRRKRQTPRREVAGGTIATQDELTRVLGILYFLSWTRTTLVNYSMSIQKYYEIPLTERCMRRRAIREDVIDLSTNNSRLNALDTARKLEAGTELVDADPEVVKLQNKFAEVLRPTAPLTDDYLVKDRFVTVSEAAALNRLRTLIRMGGSWLKKTTDMEIWMEKNRKVLIGKASEVSSAFEHAVCGFNAVCVLGEVYGLEAVDRQNARKEYARYLARYGRPKLETYNAVLDVPKTVKAEEYIGTLQARINYHRTIIHIIGASTISIFQILLRSVPQELMETTTKALNEVASRLPPAFRNPKEPPLSEFARVFLNDPPPDTFELPFSEVERTGYKDSSKSSARPARSKKSKVERTHSVVKSVSESRGSLKESNTQNSTMAAKSAATHTNSNVPRQSKSKKKSSVSSRMPVSTSDVLSDSRSDRDTT